MKLPLLLTLCDKLAVATKANSDSHWWWKCAWICPKCKSEGVANKSLTCDPLHTSHCNSLKPVLPKAEHVNFTSNCTVNRSCTCPVCLSLVTLCTELHVGHCNFASDSSQLCPKRRRTLPGRKLLGPSQRFLVSAVLHHKGHLRTHLRTHSGEKSNKCTQCDYSSSEAGNFWGTFEETHSGEKPNECNQCDYAASQVGNLRKHMKIHSGEKSNQCKQCEKSNKWNQCTLGTIA